MLNKTCTIESKVKCYIAKIKEGEIKSAEAKKLKLNVTSNSKNFTQDATLQIDEYLKNNDYQPTILCSNTSINDNGDQLLLKKLEKNCDIERILRLAFAERSEKIEANTVLSQMQVDYNQLQKKYADAENKIDKLRYGCGLGTELNCNNHKPHFPSVKYDFKISPFSSETHLRNIEKEIRRMEASTRIGNQEELPDLNLIPSINQLDNQLKHIRTQVCEDVMKAIDKDGSETVDANFNEQLSTKDEPIHTELSEIVDHIERLECRLKSLTREVESLHRVNDIAKNSTVDSKQDVRVVGEKNIDLLGQVDAYTKVAEWCDKLPDECLRKLERKFVTDDDGDDIQEQVTRDKCEKIAKLSKNCRKSNLSAKNDEKLANSFLNVSTEIDSGYPGSDFSFGGVVVNKRDKNLTRESSHTLHDVKESEDEEVAYSNNDLFEQVSKEVSEIRSHFDSHREAMIQLLSPNKKSLQVESPSESHRSKTSDVESSNRRRRLRKLKSQMKIESIHDDLRQEYDIPPFNIDLRICAQDRSMSSPREGTSKEEVCDHKQNLFNNTHEQQKTVAERHAGSSLSLENSNVKEQKKRHSSRRVHSNSRDCQLSSHISSNLKDDYSHGNGSVESSAAIEELLEYGVPELELQKVYASEKKELDDSGDDFTFDFDRMVHTSKSKDCVDIAPSFIKTKSKEDVHTRASRCALVKERRNQSPKLTQRSKRSQTKSKSEVPATSKISSFEAAHCDLEEKEEEESEGATSDSEERELMKAIHETTLFAKSLLSTSKVLVKLVKNNQNCCH